MEADRSINRLASRQHGLVTRQQALECGAPRAGIEWKLDQGQWLIVRPAVCALAGAPVTWEQAVLAACLAGGPAAFASHHTALRLWGLDERIDQDGIHVTSPPGRRIRLDGIVAHRTTLLAPLDVSRRTGVPCTTAARAIVEVSGTLGSAATGKLLDLAIRRHRGELEAVRACVARLAGPGRRRLTVIRHVLGERLPGWDPGDSDLEVRVLRALHRAGFAPPVQQHPVHIDGRRRRIDLAYPDLKIAIELDGWDAHGVRSAFDADRARRNELTILGWRVVQFTSAMTDREVVDQVGRLLTSIAA